MIPSNYPENRSQKIVVIGAGLAGLTAAYRLKKEGLDVDLYEARNRVGGRIFTVHVNANIAELGAENIADGGDGIHIHRLIKELDLELTRSRLNLDSYYFNEKNLISVKQLLRKKEFNSQTLRNQLIKLASKSHNMKEVLGTIIEEKDPLYKIIAVRLADYEGASIEKLSTFYTETLFHMLLGGICFAHQGNAEEENYMDFIGIKGGNALLPEKMAVTLGAQLHLNMPLTCVGKAEDGSFVLTFRDDQTVKADILILAIPCSVYEKIIFEKNTIALERLEAIKSVQYGTNAKILVPFSTVPLKKNGWIDDQSVSFFNAARTVLTLHYAGKAGLFSADTILSRYAQSRSMIEMGCGSACPLFIPPVFAGNRAFAGYNTPVGYSWPNDPYAKGSYAYISAGQETLLTAITKEKGEKFKTLFAPIQQKLYFAGEHTSILMDVTGTMEAACESGERVARAILTGIWANARLPIILELSNKQQRQDSCNAYGRTENIANTMGCQTCGSTSKEKTDVEEGCNTINKLLVGGSIGFFLGTVVALLLAPKSKI